MEVRFYDGLLEELKKKGITCLRSLAVFPAPDLKTSATAESGQKAHRLCHDLDVSGYVCIPCSGRLGDIAGTLYTLVNFPHVMCEKFLRKHGVTEFVYITLKENGKDSSGHFDYDNNRKPHLIDDSVTGYDVGNDELLFTGKALELRIQLSDLKKFNDTVISNFLRNPHIFDPSLDQEIDFWMNRVGFAAYYHRKALYGGK